MNHSGIGKINRDGTVSLPSDLLKPLSITNDIKMWGIYYPPDLKNTEYLGSTRHDFMFSPIPFELWDCTGKIVIRTKHRKGAFFDIADCLNRNGASILLSEASRSAHRYDTWSMIVAFEKLREMKGLSYDEDSNTYKETMKELIAMEKSLREECADVLFFNSSDDRFQKSVEITPHSAMSYFNHVVEERPQGAPVKGNIDWAAYKPFTLKCEGSTLLKSSDETFERILSAICAENENIKPSFVFAEADTNDANIRLAIIEPSIESEFFSCQIYFERHGLPGNSKGFVASILENFKKNANVWSITNKTMSFEEEYEIGETHLIVRDSLNSTLSSAERGERLTNLLNQKVPSNIRNVSVTCSDLNSIAPHSKEEIMSEGQFKYDVFVSYASEDSSEAYKIQSIIEENDFNVFMAGKNLTGGDDFDETIRHSLVNSMEIVLLCSSSSIDSDWVKREYGAAWALEKRTTPIALNMELKNLPGWLEKYQAYLFHNVVADKNNWDYLGKLRRRKGQ